MVAKRILEISRRNNLIRAERALQAIVTYVRYAEDGEHFAGADTLTENIQDLLGDLAHLCVVKGIDFEKAIDAGRGNFASEIRVDDLEEGFCASGGLERGSPLVDLPELVKVLK